jgi:hypothetical protein
MEEFMSVPRIIKKFDSPESVVVDLGQSWKLFDNNKHYDLISIYNGALSIPRGSRDRSIKRVNWIETDKGAFLIETENDIIQASKICRIHPEKIRQIFKSELIKRLNGELNSSEN